MGRLESHDAYENGGEGGCAGETGRVFWLKVARPFEEGGDGGTGGRGAVFG